MQEAAAQSRVELVHKNWNQETDIDIQMPRVFIYFKV